MSRLKRRSREAAPTGRMKPRYALDELLDGAVKMPSEWAGVKDVGRERL